MIPEYIDEDGAPERRPSIPRLMTMVPARTTDDNPPAPGTVAVNITVDTTAVAAVLDQVRERMRELGKAIGPALDRMAENARAAFAPLNEAIARTLGRVTYVTPDGPVPLPIIDADSALAALVYAEGTTVLQHPDKAHRALAKRHRLTVRRHLDPVHRPRLRRVDTNQFGGLG